MCDLDDTLVERPPVFRDWAEELVAELGEDTSAVDWVVEQDQGGHRPRAELWDELTRRFGYDVPLARFLDDQNRLVGGRYALTDGVRAALDDVRDRGWGFAVVTNGTIEVQTPKIEATGLYTLADAVCISEEVGEWKPHSLMFTTAAERAGSSLEGAWMIGDNLDADIAGAHGVGARSVWVRRDYDRLTYESGTEPDLVAADFPDAVRQVLEAARN